MVNKNNFVKLGLIRILQWLTLPCGWIVRVCVFACVFGILHDESKVLLASIAFVPFSGALFAWCFLSRQGWFQMLNQIHMQQEFPLCIPACLSTHAFVSLVCEGGRVCEVYGSVLWLPRYTATHHLTSHLERATRHHAERTTARMLPKRRIVCRPQFPIHAGAELLLFLSQNKNPLTLKLSHPQRALPKMSPSKHFASTFATLWVNLPRAEQTPALDLTSTVSADAKSLIHEVASIKRQSETLFLLLQS